MPTQSTGLICASRVMWFDAPSTRSPEKFAAYEAASDRRRVRPGIQRIWRGCNHGSWLWVVRDDDESATGARDAKRPHGGCRGVFGFLRALYAVLVGQVFVVTTNRAEAEEVENR
jgi:hypothetical protein